MQGLLLIFSKLCMQDPELMAAFSDPEVMAALQDGMTYPYWNCTSVVFELLCMVNREVMFLLYIPDLVRSNLPDILTLIVI